MPRRWVTRLYRLTLTVSTGLLVGQGCIGPNDLREAFLTSFNSMVLRAIEAFIAGLFSMPAASSTT